MMTARLLALALMFAFVTSINGQVRLRDNEKVRIWEEPIVIPTYQVDPPKHHP
jgi:hypothetical protein